MQPARYTNVATVDSHVCNDAVKEQLHLTRGCVLVQVFAPAVYQFHQCCVHQLIAASSLVAGAHSALALISANCEIVVTHGD